MTDNATDTLDRDDQRETAPVAPSELALLKARADTMKIKYSNNIGLEALRAKVVELASGLKK